MLSRFWTRLTNPTPGTTPGEARLAGLIGMVLGLALLVTSAVLYAVLMERFGPPSHVTRKRHDLSDIFMLPGFIALALFATGAYRLIFGRPEKPPSSLANVLVVLFVLLGGLVFFMFMTAAMSSWMDALLEPGA
jgi:hypothetical protein